MDDRNQSGTEIQSDDVARLSQQADVGSLRQLVDMVRSERKWFLLPILLMLMAAGAFVMLGGTGAAPFIYALF